VRVALGSDNDFFGESALVHKDDPPVFSATVRLALADLAFAPIGALRIARR
jgi:hypothetical protein